MLRLEWLIAPISEGLESNLLQTSHSFDMRIVAETEPPTDAMLAKFVTDSPLTRSEFAHVGRESC